MLAQSSKSNKAAVNLSDHLITHREKEDEQEEEAKHSRDLEPMEMAAADQRETAASETRHRKRKTTTKAPENTLPVMKETAEDKCRGKRQKDFDTAEQEEYSDDEAKKKERCRSSEDLWTQNQQKLLELALQQYSKGTAERWDKIAKCVPGKSKVMSRFCAGLKCRVVAWHKSSA